VATNADDDKTIETNVQHKVTMGGLEYPAHPYTVRISFLNHETEEMDLVDLLRPKCGPVAHARIMRSKHPPFKSKGLALVQFEEKESVEKALALDDVIGLHEKIFRIERSHLPAIPLVPPGRHQVSEKGQGKHSKRNEKKKLQHPDNSDGTNLTSQVEVELKEVNTTKPTELPQATKTPEAVATSMDVGVLAFQPRHVARRQPQRKPKLNL
jgi:RNA recognition motif-containing protein